MVGKGLKAYRDGRGREENQRADEPVRDPGESENQQADEPARPPELPGASGPTAP